MSSFAFLSAFKFRDEQAGYDRTFPPASKIEGMGMPDEPTALVKLSLFFSRTGLKSDINSMGRSC